MAQSKQELDRQLMPPPSNSLSSKTKVLSEDDYTARIERIIERDYFPDVPKMQSQLEWVVAVNTGDPLKIRQAQLNIARRRAGLNTPMTGLVHERAGTMGATPGAPDTWRPPSAMTTPSMRTPAMTPFHPHDGEDGGGNGGGAAASVQQQQAAVGGGALRAPPMSLDAFLSTHTSEDNASFSRIINENNARKRAKYAHRLEGGRKEAAAPLMLLEASGGASTAEAEAQRRSSSGIITDGYGSSGQAPYTLLTWKQEPRNQLFYMAVQRSDAPPSMKELEARARGPQREIQKSATRFKTAQEEEEEEEEGRRQLAGGAADVQRPDLPPGAPAAARLAAAGGGTAPAGGGGGGSGNAAYDRMQTPSMTPGVGFSPLMTWGDIGSTPLRLDLDLDAELAEGLASEGLPVFRISRETEKEQVARALAQHGSLTAFRRSSRPGSRAGTPLTASGGGGGAHVPGGAAAMSPAARRLAASLAASLGSGGGRGRGGKGGTPRAPGSGADLQLRASYGSLTPAGLAAAAGSRPGSALRGGGAGGGGLGGGGKFLVNPGSAGGLSSKRDRAGATASTPLSASAGGTSAPTPNTGSTSAAASAARQPGGGGSAPVKPSSITDDLLKI